MVSQLSAPTSDRPATICHLVTLIRRSDGDETSFKIITESNSYTDVSREIAHQKVERRLFGYEVFEALDLSNPF